MPSMCISGIMGQAKPQDIQVAAVTMMMSVMIMTQDNVPYRKKPPSPPPQAVGECEPSESWNTHNSLCSMINCRRYHGRLFCICTLYFIIPHCQKYFKSKDEKEFRSECKHRYYINNIPKYIKIVLLIM